MVADTDQRIAEKGGGIKMKDKELDHLRKMRNDAYEKLQKIEKLEEDYVLKTYLPEFIRKYANTFWTSDNASGGKTWKVYTHVKGIKNVSVYAEYNFSIDIVCDIFQHTPYGEFILNQNMETHPEVYCKTKLTKTQYKKALAQELEKIEQV
jgi:hypothetical protein